MQNDTVYIESPDGARSAAYKANIGSKNGVHFTNIFDASLDAPEGWTLVRVLPGDREEAYTILESNYRPGFHAIPEHWDLKLKKNASLLRQQQSKQAPVIHINNSQGIQIGDHNIQHIANSLAGLVEKIDESNAPPQQKDEAKGLVMKLLESPVVASVLGGAVTGVLGLLHHK